MILSMCDSLLFSLFIFHSFFGKYWTVLSDLNHLVFRMMSSVEFFYKHKNWQYWHYYQHLNLYDYIVFPYLHNLMLVNVKLDVSGFQRIIFQDCIIQWESYNKVGNIGNILVLQREFVKKLWWFWCNFGSSCFFSSSRIVSFFIRVPFAIKFINHTQTIMILVRK